MKYWVAFCGIVFSNSSFCRLGSGYSWACCRLDSVFRSLLIAPRPDQREGAASVRRKRRYPGSPRGGPTRCSPPPIRGWRKSGSGRRSLPGPSFPSPVQRDWAPRRPVLYIPRLLLWKRNVFEGFFFSTYINFLLRHNLYSIKCTDLHWTYHATTTQHRYRALPLPQKAPQPFLATPLLTYPPRQPLSHFYHHR